MESDRQKLVRPSQAPEPSHWLKTSTAPLIVLIVLMLLVLAGVYISQTAVSESARVTGWIVAVVGVVLSALRLVTRRR